MDSGGDIKVHVATILQLYYSFTFFYDNLMTQVSTYVPEQCNDEKLKKC